MKNLGEINDMLLLGLEGRSAAPPRITVRAVLRRRDGLYAVMYSRKFGLYSLPGGGVESGEYLIGALRRELLEETGCTCEEILELGMVAENRGCQDYTQQSYYYVVRAGENIQKNQLTEAESVSETGLEWMTFEEMFHNIGAIRHTTVQRQYLQARDMAALEEYSKSFLTKPDP